MTGPDLPRPLREALRADADTPAGMDLAAVRGRASALRRRRTGLVAGAAAVVTALAIGVPVALLGGSGPGPAPAGPAAAGGDTVPVAFAACPDQLADEPVNQGPGLAARLVPFEVDGGLVCSYQPVPKGDPAAPPLTGVARLTGAEALAVAARLRDTEPVTRDLACTSDLGQPFALRLTGPGRAVTLRLEPYGCGLVGNGTLNRATGAKSYLRDLVAKAEGTSKCPADLTGVNELYSDEPGPTMLPTGTRRLLVCQYQGAPETRGGAYGWDAAVDERTSRKVVSELNASPAADTSACTDEAGAPKVLIVAVTPDRVKRLVAETGNCRAVSDGVRSVSNPAVVNLLLKAARQR